MKKLDSVLYGFMVCGKSRALTTSTKILFCLLSIIMPKKYLLWGGAEIGEHGKSPQTLVLKHIANKLLKLPRLG